jgi:integrase
MPGTVQHAKLENRTARARLKRKKEPYWRTLVIGRAHLGWVRPPDTPGPGRWILRQYKDRKYTQRQLGMADDAAEADGKLVFSFEQAEAMARAMLDEPAQRSRRLTVREAVAAYLDFLKDNGKPTGDAECRLGAHVTPVLGDCAVADLTTPRLTRWRATLATTPAMKRSPQGKQCYRPEAKTEEEVRKRRASANRVWGMLRAALNHAYREGKVASDQAWRRVEPFKGVDQPRTRYLNLQECERLLNASDPDFKSLVRAALESGCRYSELCRLAVSDFNPDNGSILIQRSKTGRQRHVILTKEGAAFFAQHCAGRTGLMFSRANGAAWGMSLQARPMALACRRARITPPISFHGLRHTWASLAVMGGMPLIVVARNLGHVDTRMVESTYGHLSPGYINEQIRKHAPRFGGEGAAKIIPLRLP